MNWTKVPTNLLISRMPDCELLAIIKYQLLWADLECQPTDEIALRYMTHKQLASARCYLDDIEAQVCRDVDATLRHRKEVKTNYHKKQQVIKNSDTQTDAQTGTQTVAQSDCGDEMRRDEMRSTPLYPPSKTAQKDKHQYGEFQKVKLTNDEYEKLTALYGTRLDTAIDKLDNYLAQKKKDPYASHYAVMKRNGWVYNEVFDDKAEPTGPKIIGGANA